MQLQFQLFIQQYISTKKSYPLPLKQTMQITMSLDTLLSKHNSYYGLSIAIFQVLQPGFAILHEHELLWRRDTGPKSWESLTKSSWVGVGVWLILTTGEINLNLSRIKIRAMITLPLDITRACWMVNSWMYPFVLGADAGSMSAIKASRIWWIAEIFNAWSWWWWPDPDPDPVEFDELDIMLFD